MNLAAAASIVAQGVRAVVVIPLYRERGEKGRRRTDGGAAIFRRAVTGIPSGRRPSKLWTGKFWTRWRPDGP